jgi:protein involved in polysaccharide export with SLBB domain
MKDTVMLVGAVSSPGPRPFKGEQTIRDFFLQSTDAGVLNPANVNLVKTQVIRRGEKKPFDVDLQQVLKKPQRKDNLVLKTGDIIFLPPRRDRGRGLYDYIRDVPMVGFLFGLF